MLLQEYEKQYSILTAEITSQIGRLNQASADERRNLIIDVNQKLDESQELLEQIGLEINQNTDSQQKASQLSKFKCYQKELKRLEEDYNRTKTKTNDLTSYLDDSSLDDFEIGEDQKQRLLSNSERIERTSNSLDDAYRVAIETEEIGAHVLTNLHTQRETIQRNKQRMRETNADLGRSARIMNNMLMRSIRDKFVLYIVGVIFVVAVTLTLYFSLK